MSGPGRGGRQRARFHALAGLSLALVTGCARTGTERPPIVTPPPGSVACVSTASPAPVEPAPFPPPTATDSRATVVFRLSVEIDGEPRSFSTSAIHLVRTDLIPSWRPERRIARVDPRVSSVGPHADGWCSVVLSPGRYHLNAVDKRHFPTARGVPPLVLEVVPGDKVAYAGSIEMSCRDRLPPGTPGRQAYDCDPPTISTDEAATAARLSGNPTVEPAIRPARPLLTLTSPDLAPRSGTWTLEADRGDVAGLPSQPFPEFHQAGADAAANGGVALATSLACGPWFAFCAAILVPAVAAGSAVEGGVEHHGNTVRRECNDRLARELREFNVEGHLHAALRERFASAGRPLAEPASAPGEPPPAVVLRVAVLRIGVRGDTCLPGFNPFKLSDRYRADILAGVRAVDGATGGVLYEEFLTNTEKLSQWDVLAGRGSLTPVGSRAECRRVKEFCPEGGEEVLGNDLEPAIDAFADHVVAVLTGAAKRPIPSS